MLGLLISPFISDSNPALNIFMDFSQNLRHVSVLKKKSEVLAKKKKGKMILEALKRT
jgi:hypothetical protein